MLLFTYGTLLRGEVRHDLLTDRGAEFVGEAVVDGFTLRYPAMTFGYPAIVAQSGSLVVGEVYRIDDETRRVLDIIEGHPNLYRREELDVLVVDFEPRSSRCAVYVWNGYGGQMPLGAEIGPSWRRRAAMPALGVG